MALALPPSIFLLGTILPDNELEQLKTLTNLTDNISEAKLVIGKVNQRKRAQFELRNRGIWTRDVEDIHTNGGDTNSTPPRKRRKIEEINSGTESDNESQGTQSSVSSTHSTGRSNQVINIPESPVTTSATSRANSQKYHDSIRVVKLAWIKDSLKAGVLLPIDKNYLVYEGTPTPKPDQPNSTAPVCIYPPPDYCH